MEIKGIIPAMVTPFDADETVNIKAIKPLVEHLLAGKVHGLFPTGSQGEYYALSADECQLVWETVVDQVNGRVPVYAGTGANTTREVIDLNMRAAKAGASAVSVITPNFLRPTDQELYTHYITIADASPLPVILYGNPARTGIALSAELVARLAEHPNIVGIKDSTGDLSLTLQYIAMTGDDFASLMGRDTLIYAALVHGSRGSITATANVVPGLVSSIYEAFVAGDHESAMTAQEKLSPLRYAFSWGTFPVVVKQALNMMGIPVGAPRAPVGLMLPENEARLRQVLVDLGVMEK